MNKTYLISPSHLPSYCYLYQFYFLSHSFLWWSQSLDLFWTQPSGQTDPRCQRALPSDPPTPSAPSSDVYQKGSWEPVGIGPGVHGARPSGSLWFCSSLSLFGGDLEGERAEATPLCPSTLPTPRPWARSTPVSSPGLCMVGSQPVVWSQGT